VMNGVPEPCRKQLAGALNAARVEQSGRQQAWILRHGLDRT